MKDLLPDPETICPVCGELDWYITEDGGTRTFRRHLSCKRKRGAPYRRGRTRYPLSYIVRSDTPCDARGGTIIRKVLTDKESNAILGLEAQTILILEE